MVMLAAMFTFTPAFAQDAADEFGGAEEDVVEVVEEPAAPAADNADADAGAGGGISKTNDPHANGDENPKGNKTADHQTPFGNAA